MRTSQMALLIAFAAAAARAIVLYPRLPERIATHFGAGGQADDWGAKSTFFALMLGTELLWVGLFLFLPQLVRRMPAGLVNLPNRRYWLAPERRDEAVRRITDYLGWLGAAMILFFAGITELTARATLDGSERLSPQFGWLLGAFLVLVVLWVVRFVLSFRLPRDVA